MEEAKTITLLDDESRAVLGLLQRAAPSVPPAKPRHAAGAPHRFASDLTNRPHKVGGLTCLLTLSHARLLECSNMCPEAGRVCLQCNVQWRRLPQPSGMLRKRNRGAKGRNSHADNCLVAGVLLWPRRLQCRDGPGEGRFPARQQHALLHLRQRVVQPGGRRRARGVHLPPSSLHAGRQCSQPDQPQNSFGHTQSMPLHALFVQEPGAQRAPLGPTSFAGMHFGAGGLAVVPTRRTAAGPSNLLGMLHSKALLGSQEDAAGGQNADEDIRSIMQGNKRAGLAARRR